MLDAICVDPTESYENEIDVIIHLITTNNSFRWNFLLIFVGIIIKWAPNETPQKRNRLSQNK